MANVIFKTGTKEQYNALQVKDTNTLYWLYDVLELRKGEQLYGTGAEATNLASGLMSAADKAKLDSLAGGTALGLTAVDGSVVIADGEDGGRTIGVRISQAAENALSLKEDGLFAAAGSGNAAEFAIEKQEEAAEGYAATYKLKKTSGETVTYAGDIINIPKDLVLQDGELETVTEADKPYAGAAVGDFYLNLLLNNPDNKNIYIPLKDAFGEVGTLVWEEM